MAEVPRFYSSTAIKATGPKTEIKIRRLQPIPSMLIMDHSSSFASFFERIADMTVNANNEPKHETRDNTLRSLLIQEKELEGENAELGRKYKEALEKSDVSYAAYLKAGNGFSQEAAKVFNEAWRLKEELRREIFRHETILEGVREDITTLRKDGD